jgi:hypothetical protein
MVLILLNLELVNKRGWFNIFFITQQLNINDPLLHVRGEN